MKKLQKYARLAKELGANGAKIIPIADVFVRDWVLLKCKFGCEGYGGCLTCPPCSPSPEQTRRVLAEYRYALLMHFVREPGKKKPKKKFTITKFVADLERTIFLAGYFKAWGMGCGPCRLCKTCNFDECRHPRDARPSMEACGISVFETARKAGFPIEVVTDFDKRSNRFGLILIE